MQESITEITSSLDWPDIETQIRTLGKTAPEFKFDIANQELLLFALQGYKEKFGILKLNTKK